MGGVPFRPVLVAANLGQPNSLIGLLSERQDGESRSRTPGGGHGFAHTMAEKRGYQALQDPLHLRVARVVGWDV